MTLGPRVVFYVVRERPETGFDEVVVVDGDEVDRSRLTIVRELGVAAGTRFVHAVLREPAAEWEDRWETLTLRHGGPFADALVRDRVVAYVTRERPGGAELLTIAPEDDPEALEVPAGRLDHGETLEQGLLRELAEETGFTGVRVVRELAGFECTYRTFSHNHAFQLEAVEETPAGWRHEVYGHGVDAGMVHICRWVRLTPELELWNARDPMLAKLEL